MELLLELAPDAAPEADSLADLRRLVISGAMSAGKSFHSPSGRWFWYDWPVTGFGLVDGGGGGGGGGGGRSGGGAAGAGRAECALPKLGQPSNNSGRPWGRRDRVVPGHVKVCEV